jgi:anti-anti-sigma factor
MDMVGVEEIDLRFTALTAAMPLRVLLDLSEVPFLASVGIRLILQNARALDRKGGRMVIFLGPNGTVKSTLDSVGVSGIVPVFDREADALDALGAPAD